MPVSPVVPYVVAVTATYRRPKELARLLKCLPAAGESFGMIVVVDNSGSEEVERVVEQASCKSHYVKAAANLGCGGGLRLAEETAWKIAGERLTHLLILDDDVVLGAGTLDRLLDAMTAANAATAYPAVMDETGRVGWLPGLLQVSRRDYHRLNVPLADFRQRCPNGPLYFSWAPGICLLVTRAVIQSEGFHRDDFWIRGEDAEFSLRVTNKGRGLFVADVLVEHLPPAMNSAGLQNAEYLKHCAMLQNVAFIGCRLPHGRVIRKTIPGNVVRLLRTWGARSLVDVIRAVWRGAVWSQPAGTGKGNTFLSRFGKLKSA